MGFFKFLFFGWLCFIVVLLWIASTIHNQKKNAEFENPSGAYLSGMVAYDEKDVPNALHFLTKAMMANPFDLEVQAKVIVAAAIANNQQIIDQMMEDFGDKQNDSVLLSLARAADSFYFAQLYPKNADEYYRQALDYIHRFPKKGFNELAIPLLSAWAYVGEGQEREAILVLKNTKISEELDIYLQYHLALIYAYQNHYKEAEEYFVKLLKERKLHKASASFYERVFCYYAVLLSERGQQEKLKTLLDSGPDIFRNYSDFRYFIRFLKKPPYDLFKFKNVSRGASEALATVGFLFTDDEDFGLFLVYMRLAEFVSEDNDLAAYYTSLRLLKAGYPHYAIKTFQKIPKESLYYQDGLLHCIFYYIKEKDHKRIVKLLKRLQKVAPYNSRTSLAFLIYYTTTQQWNKAYNYMLYFDTIIDKVKIFNRDMPCWRFYYQKALIYEHYGELDRTEDFLRKALKKAPNSPIILSYLGYFLVENGKNITEAIGFLSKAAQLEPQNSYILDSLGWAYYKLEYYAEAIYILLKALKLDPLDPIANEHLGDVYWRIGREREAIFQWNYALSFTASDRRKSDLKEKLKLQLRKNEKDFFKKDEF